MKRLFGIILAVLLCWSTAAHADSLGCFNASQSVHIWAQFANASGVATSPTTPAAKVFSPTDTTAASFTPTLAEIDATGSPGLTRGSFTLGASPTAGIWTVRYQGTVGGNVLVATDVFQVPCPSVAIRAGGITASSFASDGTISAIATVTLTLSADVIAATNQFAYQAQIQVYNPTTFLLKANACIIASTTAAGPADTVTTAEDISALIAVADAFIVAPDPACRNLRPTTAGNTFDKIGYALTSAEHTAIAGDVWNAPRSSHTAAGTFGQALQVIRSGTAQAGAVSTITLDASASATDNLYNNSQVWIVGGTGAGQTRQISSYVGSTKVATVNANWAITPDATSVFMILPLGITPQTSGLTAADVWTYSTRALTDKTGFSLAAGAIVAATFGVGAIDAAAIAPGAITASEAPNLDAAVTSRLASASYTAPDNATIGTIAGYLCNGTGSCAAPTNTGVWNRLDAVLSTRSSQSSLDLKIPTNFIFTGSFVRAQVAAIDNDAITAAAIAPSAIGPSETGLPTGSVQAGAANCNGGTNSPTTFATSLTQATTNHWSKTQLITFTSGSLLNQTAQISGYTWTGAVGCLSVTSTLGLTGTPGVGDTFAIVNK